MLRPYILLHINIESQFQSGLLCIYKVQVSGAQNKIKELIASPQVLNHLTEEY